MYYAFANFKLDLNRRELKQGGSSVPMRPKVYDLLLYMIENRDRVVSKAEVFDAVWPGVVVGDAALNTCMKILRRTLNDDGRSQQIIRTQHGHGYRFVAEVEAVNDAEQNLPPREARKANESTEVVTQTSRQIRFPSGREHKNVTVLHCELYNATLLANTHGDEKLGEWLDTLITHGHHVTQSFEGSTSQWLAEGFVVLFGAPYAQEDHVRRAVSAALELKRELADLAVPELNLAIGLHSGPVVVGFRGQDRSQIFSALGPTTETARKLCSESGANEITASAELVELLADELDAIPSQDRYLIQSWAKQHSGILRSGSRTRSRFVGRDLELLLLSQRLGELPEEGKVICITGEPGMGKSRLIEEFAEHLNPEEHQYHIVDCLPYETDSPFLPVGRLISQMIGVERNEGSESITARLTELFEDEILHERFLNDIRSLIFTNESITDGHADISDVWSGLHQLILKFALRLPTVIVLENIQWMDPSSSQLVEKLIQSLESMPVLLLLTYRPGFTPAFLENQATTQLSLGKLSRSDSELLVLSLAKPGDPTYMDSILKLGQGNPFFLEELSNSAQTETMNGLPNTIQALLASRVDTLQETSKGLLQHAAIIGTRFDYQLLARIDGLTEDTRDAALNDLQKRELIYLQRLHPERRFAFKHALTHEVVLNGMMSSYRKPIHARLAQVLQQQYPRVTERYPEQVARHLEASGDVSGAIEFFDRAGVIAINNYADSETASHYKKALSLLRQLPPSSERDAREIRFILRITSAVESLTGDKPAEERSFYEHARTLDTSMVEDSDRFMLRWNLWHWGVDKQMANITSLADHILDEARQADDPAMQAQAHHKIWGSSFHAARFENAIQHCREGLELLIDDENILGDIFGHDIRSCGHGVLGTSLLIQGKTREAYEHLQQSEARALAIHHPSTTSDVRTRFLEAMLITGDLSEMESQLSLCRKEKQEYSLGYLSKFYAWCDVYNSCHGEPEDPQSTLNELAILTDGLISGISNSRRSAMHAGLCAEQFMNRDELDHATNYLQIADSEVGNPVSDHWYAAELCRLHGDLHLRQGQRKQGIKAYETAVAVASEQSAYLFELRARLRLHDHGVITVKGLRKWLDEHSFMSSSWEYIKACEKISS